MKSSHHRGGGSIDPAAPDRMQQIKTKILQCALVCADRGMPMGGPDGYECRCPLVMVAEATGRYKRQSLTRVAADELGMTEDETWSLIGAYDDCNYGGTIIRKPAVRHEAFTALGLELRQIAGLS